MRISQVQPDIEELKVVLEAGFALCDLGRLDEAEKIFLGAGELTSDSEVPLVGLSRVYLQRGRYAEAKAACEEGMMRNPESLYARVHRAEAMLFQGDKKEAVRELQDVVERGPESPHSRTAAALLEIADVICTRN